MTYKWTKMRLQHNSLEEIFKVLRKNNCSSIKTNKMTSNREELVQKKKTKPQRKEWTSQVNSERKISKH